jgi:hypothetical protein
MALLARLVEQGEFSALEADDVALADLVIRDRGREDDTQIYLWEAILMVVMAVGSANGYQ